MRRTVVSVMVFIGPLVFSKPLSLQFWHSMTGEKGKVLQGLVSQFNELPENRGKVFFRSQFVGNYEEGINKLRTSLIVGKGPNVIQITDVGTQLMIDSKAMAPLADFIASDPSFPYKEILPQIRRYYEVRGRLYSLPFSTSNPILYYNRDAFEKAGLSRAPQTFRELLEYSRKLTDPKTRTTGITWPLHSWFLEQFLAVQGVPLTDQNNGRTGRAAHVNFTVPEAIAFVNLWHQLVREGVFANVGRGWDPAAQSFLAARTLMLITTTSDVFEIIKRAPFRVGTAALPKPDLKVKGGTVLGGNSLWILKQKKSLDEQRASYLFVKFLASAEVQKKWHQSTGYFPIRSDVIEALRKEGFYKQYPQGWVPIEQLRASPSLPATQGALMGVFPESRENVESAIEEVLSGRSETIAALTKAKEQTEEALARYNQGMAHSE